MTKKIAVFVVLVVLFMVVFTLAEAGPPPATPPPPPDIGVVDAEPFKALAGPDGPVTEIYLKGSLLKLISQGFASEDPETGKVVGGLDAVTTIVIELKASQLEAARSLVNATTKRLMTRGWEILARVKDKGSNITVLTRSNDSEGLFHGLQLFVLDGDANTEDGEATYDLVFANIAGPMRFSDIAKIGEAFELPAIEDAADAIVDPDK